jgi:hypothetical protein
MISEEFKEQLIRHYEDKIAELEALTTLLHEYQLGKAEFSKEEMMLLSEEDRNKLRFKPGVNMNRFKIEMKRWLDSLKTE